MCNLAALAMLVHVRNVVRVCCVSGNATTQVAMMMKSDARADVLAENAQLADDFIKTLFAISYEVYGSSVQLLLVA